MGNGETYKDRSFKKIIEDILKSLCYNNFRKEWMIMAKDFYSAVKDRRSFYGISKETTISNERLKQIVEDAVKYAPSAFHSQSGRVLLLLGAHHDNLWEVTKEALKKVVPEDKFDETREKIDSFQSGYGTILFFEDQEVVEGLQNQFPLYKDNFPIWSQQSSGMLQFILWTGLESEGLGVSLQHYNELIEDKVKEKWELPVSWKLIAQMPFGKPNMDPMEKDFEDLNKRIKVFE